MAEKIPPLLQAVTDIPDIERARLRAHARSWMSLNKVIKKLPEMDLLKIIVLELQGERRPIIIARCLSRYRTARENRENQELFDCAADVAAKMAKERERSRA